MSESISDSVGSYESGAQNLAEDVRTVQEMLTRVAKKLGQAYDPGAIDGRIAKDDAKSSTVQAITNFQIRQCHMISADKRIDVDGKTWQRLVTVAGPAAPKLEPITELVTLTVSHGGRIPTNTKLTKRSPTAGTGMYESNFKLSGGLSGSFRGSIYPDDMTSDGRVIDGSYALHLGFHGGQDADRQTSENLVAKTRGVRAALLINARAGVAVESDDEGKTMAFDVDIHNGSYTNRLSNGSLTVHPDEWYRFMKLFLDGFSELADWQAVAINTGKKIGTLVIQP